MAFRPACWPLCGRIADAPPTVTWLATDGCPLSRCDNATFSDLPISTSFGPRPLGSENERFDFHRGLDISCQVGTPIFAIADGTVLVAGISSSYSDPVIVIRHYRPGFATCTEGGGCYTSQYIHMRPSSAGGCCVVSAGDTVVAGALIGYSGASSFGYPHLHFEIRDAPADDPLSSWQRDSIHALRVLRYPAPEAADAVEVRVEADGGNISVAINTTREDVLGVSLELFGDDGARVVQPGDTPDARGYHVFPASYLYDELNRQYTHKDSTNVPWSTFGPGGARECPFHVEHGASYDAHVHLDSTAAGAPKVGHFGGVRVELQPLRSYSREHRYAIRWTFEQLVGAPFGCVNASVHLAGGGRPEYARRLECFGLPSRSVLPSSGLSSPPVLPPSPSAMRSSPALPRAASSASEESSALLLGGLLVAATVAAAVGVTLALRRMRLVRLRTSSARVPSVVEQKC